ncbi:MAG: hypothetical protein LBT77_02010 [Mycoplasmataceae bacterium]|nr:hypothetical protein [Mycoplasmataceae bacterium]
MTTQKYTIEELNKILNMNIQKREGDYFIYLSKKTGKIGKLHKNTAYDQASKRNNTNIKVNLVQSKKDKAIKLSISLPNSILTQVRLIAKTNNVKVSYLITQIIKQSFAL